MALLTLQQILHYRNTIIIDTVRVILKLIINNIMQPVFV
jgi:hypothetical protein